MCNMHFGMQVEIYLHNKYWALQFLDTHTPKMPYVPLKMFGGAFPSFQRLFALCAGEQVQMHGALLNQRLKRAFGILATYINNVQVTGWAVVFTGLSSETKPSQLEEPINSCLFQYYQERRR